jgi:hypothetical protein
MRGRTTEDAVQTGGELMGMHDTLPFSISMAYIYYAASTADRPGAKTAASVAGGGTKDHKSRPVGGARTPGGNREYRSPLYLSILWLIRPGSRGGCRDHSRVAALGVGIFK